MKCLIDFTNILRWSLDDPNLMRYRLLIIIYKSYDARMKEAVLILINA